MQRLKLGHDTKRYNDAVKSNQAKFDAGTDVINYINEIVGKSGALKIEDALAEPMSYIRLHFYNVHANSIPMFVKKDKAIDLSDYSEREFSTIVDKYISIDAVPPIQNGKIAHIQVKETDFDSFLAESKREKYELLEQLCEVTNKLSEINAINVAHVYTSVGTNLKFNVSPDTHKKFITINEEYFIED